MAVRHAAAAGIVIVAAAIGISLLHSDHRIVGTNTIGQLTHAMLIDGGDRKCQLVPEVPAGAGFVRLRAETDSGSVEGVRVRISRSGGSGGTVSGRSTGRIEVPLEPPTRAITGARLCVSNLGGEQLRLFGEQKRPYPGAPPRTWPGYLGVTFLDAEPSTLFSRLGAIKLRFGYGHAGAIGTWALWLAGGLALAGSAAALWQMARTVPRK